MSDFFDFLINNQKWIYILLGITGLIYLRRLLNSIQEWQSTIFGLERENAQRRLNTSLVMLILIMMIAASEFITVRFIIPSMPKVSITPETSVANPESTQTDADSANSSNLQITNPYISTSAASGISESGCIPGQIEWLTPFPGEEISGDCELYATINIKDMGFFQYSYAPLSTPDVQTIINVSSLPVVEGEIGVWATNAIANGDYVLRLSVFDKTKEAFAPCDVAIRVMNAAE